jgi:hypothetical protein
MNPKIDSWKRRIFFFFAVFPIVGRNNYERMNSRLERQIHIRDNKRKSISFKNKSKQLYPFYEGQKITPGSFFDSESQ